MGFVSVRHNIEVAHRLTQLPGNKCENIHGHSMWVEMRLNGKINHVNGLLMPSGHNEGVEFGKLKRVFREYLDGYFDHHLLLNEKDPWANLLNVEAAGADMDELPGLTKISGDPTTENIAIVVGRYMAGVLQTDVFIEVAETHVNKAGILAIYDPINKSVHTA